MVISLQYAQIEHFSSPEKPGQTCPAFRYAASENKASKTVVKMSSKQPALSFRGKPRQGRIARLDSRLPSRSALASLSAMILNEWQRRSSLLDGGKA
jgi:hypothetical protein